MAGAKSLLYPCKLTQVKSLGLRVCGPGSTNGFGIQGLELPVAGPEG